MRPILARMTIVGRYAPSPTGFLHAGNLRTALIAWLAVRLQGGRFLLRVEDIDGPRTIPGCAERQLEELAWLGLDWDGAVVWQSGRDEIYCDALDRLEERSALFWCTCSRKDIALASSAPHGPDGPPYPGTCRGKSKEAQLAHPNGAAARVMAPSGVRSFEDAFLGRVTGNMAVQGGDFVVKRRDGLWGYQLACAVDDAIMGVTQVVRGEDLATSTFKQLHLQKTCGMDSPREWWHVPLLLDQDGERLAKRDGALSLAARREAGARAGEIVGELAHSLGLTASRESISPGQLRETITLNDLKAACRLRK